MNDRIKCGAAAAVTLAMLAGCVSFPYGQSLDRHNFVSTPEMPLTLTLTDVMTGETVWSLDVPVFKMAVVDLDHDARWTAAYTPHLPATRIRWGVFEPNARVGLLDEKQDLSGNPVVLKVSIREKGEPYTPPGEAKGQSPAGPVRDINDLGSDTAVSRVQ